MIFKYASSSTLYPCDLANEWAEVRTSIALRLVLDSGHLLAIQEGVICVEVFNQILDKMLMKNLDRSLKVQIRRGEDAPSMLIN